MSQGTCDCCDHAICLAPQLWFDSVSSSKDKCSNSFPEYAGHVSTPPKYYGDKTFVCPSRTGHTTCTDKSACTFSSDFTITFPHTTFQGQYCACSGTFGASTTTATTTTVHCSDGFDYSESISNEYTTAQLKTNVENALGAYPGTFTLRCCAYFEPDGGLGSCGGYFFIAGNAGAPGCLVNQGAAFRDLATDERVYTLRRSKFKIVHQPTASCYLKVWLQYRFRPKSDVGNTGNSDTVIDFADSVFTGGTYEWSGNPTDGVICFADKTKSFDHASNQVQSSVSDEINEGDIDTIGGADSNGMLFVEIKKWSCLEGYEPDDPNYNGSRPDPDTKPNGWPTIS